MFKNSIDEVQYLFMIKAMKKLGIDGNFLNPMKIIYGKP